jgi:hypothetical protein
MGMSRRHNFIFRDKTAANERAGANRFSRDVRGQHTYNPGFRYGDNWAECQRCGFDVYASDLKEDGYKKGLMVCPLCYDPPHPQDYVRVVKDDPSPIWASGENSDSTAAEGSTDVYFAAGTMGLEITGELGTLADRTDAELDVVSVDPSTSFPTAIYDPLLGGLTAAWSATGLPTGVTINSSTGVMSGTLSITANDDGSPYTTKVTQSWGGVIYSLSFTWTVTETGPDSIAGLCLWWDFSDTTTLWQDIARTTQADGDGDPVKYVDDKSTAGNDGSENNSDRWPFLRVNGNGTNFTLKDLRHRLQGAGGRREPQDGLRLHERERYLPRVRWDQLLAYLPRDQPYRSVVQRRDLRYRGHGRCARGLRRRVEGRHHSREWDLRGPPLEQRSPSGNGHGHARTRR